ncbi:MAG TPA: hypothetical protein VE913_22215 [Longimicrobium sp.]|nr:hypothetical protein [Longimicrobium sp.]
MLPAKEIASPDLNERIAGGEKRRDPRPDWHHARAQGGISYVSARDPNNLRRCSVPIQEPDEVIVLRDHNRRTSRARCREDYRIILAQEPDLVHVFGVDPVVLGQPSGEHRRELGVNPHTLTGERRRSV